MREWLTVIIILLIVAVLLDGLRRMRQSKRTAIRLSSHIRSQALQPSAGCEQLADDYGSELPSGGARVVNVRKAEDAEETNTQIKQNAEYKRKNQLKSFRIPEQVSLNLDHQVPTLMESLADGPLDGPEDQHQEPARENGRIEPSFHVDEALEEVANTAEGEVDFSFDHSELDNSELDHSEQSPGERSSPGDLAYEGGGNTSSAQAALYTPADPVPSPQTERRSTSKPDTLRRVEEDVTDDYDAREPELVLAINVMAPLGKKFSGEELLDIVLGQGLRFGAMNIFHRHEEEHGEGEILYSMANIVVPGTFELANMKHFSTPGVSLFMTLPMDANSTDAFEEMLTTAKILGARLQGELKDENRSVLTPQTISHYRSKLQEFARQQLSKAPV